jgi:protoheme IX farnesyltransferase
MSKLFEGGLARSIRKYFDLTKFKLSVLNGIVTVASYSLYATTLPAFPLFASSVALSMSTQALNQYIEIEFDRKMKRTCQRPLVLGMNPKYALLNGVGLGLAGIAGLYSYSPMTAALGGVIWAGYLFVYTKMKTTSEWNTMVGSVVGSLPVYLGWIAAGRSYCMIEPFAIFMYMMAWQHQHFYGIRWIYYDDYNNAGFRMERSKQIAAAHVIFQTILTLVFTNYAIRYYDIPNCLLLNIPLSAGLYWWGIRAAFQFAEGKIGAKEFKMQSYKHFCLVFAIFLACKLLGNNDGSKLSRAERNKVEI